MGCGIDFFVVCLGLFGGRGVVLSDPWCNKNQLSCVLDMGLEQFVLI